MIFTKLYIFLFFETNFGLKKCEKSIMKNYANLSEPSSTSNQQPQSIRGGSPKTSEPSPTSPTGNIGNAHNSTRLGPAGDVSYNSRLFKSIMKGASDFKCKHCGESFDKLDSLTKHMMIQVRLIIFFCFLRINIFKIKSIITCFSIFLNIL